MEMATCQLSVEKQMFKEKSCKQALQVAPTAILRHNWTCSYVHLSLLDQFKSRNVHLLNYNATNATIKQLFKKTSTIYSKFYHGINCHIVLPPRLIL